MRSFGVCVLLAVTACGDDSRTEQDASTPLDASQWEDVSTPDASALPATTKGYELYAWREGGVLRFTLITGTNRPKTTDEIAGQSADVIEDEWVLLRGRGIDELERVLRRVPRESSVVLVAAEGLTALSDEDRAAVMRLLGRDAATTGCAVDQTYKFGYQGGLIAWTDRFELAAGFLTKSRESSARFDAGNGNCRVPLESCSELANALRDPDVLRAYSDKDEVLGNDPRIVDGSVLVVEREDGAKIIVGGGCNGAADCTPAPAGVQALQSALAKLIQENDDAPVDAGAGRCP